MPYRARSFNKNKWANCIRTLSPRRNRDDDEQENSFRWSIHSLVIASSFSQDLSSNHTFSFSLDGKLLWKV